MKINHINIEVTKICNQNCFYCFNDSKPKSLNKSLSFNEWEKLLMEAKNKGLRSVHLTGGEPFTYRDIIKLIDVCLNLGLETSILSNGFRISSNIKLYPEIFKQLKVAQISLDSLNEEINNKRRGYKNAFKDSLSAINALYNLSVPIEISMAIDDENVFEVDDIILFAEKFGANLILRPLVKKGRSNFENFIEISEILEKYKNHQNIFIEDKFRYVTHLPINDKKLIDLGFLTLMPEGDILSKHLNKMSIVNFKDLLNVA